MAASSSLLSPPPLFLPPPPSPSSRSFLFPSSSRSPLPRLLRRTLTLRPSSAAAPRRGGASFAAAAALGKFSEAELVAVPDAAEEVEAAFPSGAGVYGVYDKDGELQFVGVTRNIAASVATHKKALPELCCSVKVGLVDQGAPDRTVLTDAWKSWMEEHISATGKIPPGNETGNNTWVCRPKQKPDLRLTPGRHVELMVPLEALIDKLVKENKVVAFIKGSRSAPQCGFSQRVVGILEAHGADFESVDVLDEEYNYGLRETLKKYSNWPTFPQVFVGGELVGGCDIIASMAEKGELAALLQKQ
ncbi:monothiol glutaredoxin-S12, chloroplastic [Ananas comosus]|uniref:Monothiol glutaredoxin-S12, chloroplastic n=1 Tax=Ananas comosus TaxID=4615 RepID=A0A6P5H281_ANACO|nr:monothiol glutaredoxin-S12, chloroplastic [Ananas comosus]